MGDLLVAKFLQHLIIREELDAQLRHMRQLGFLADSAMHEKPSPARLRNQTLPRLVFSRVIEFLVYPLDNAGPNFFVAPRFGVRVTADIADRPEADLDFDMPAFHGFDVRLHGHQVDFAQSALNATNREEAFLVEPFLNQLLVQ